MARPGPCLAPSSSADGWTLLLTLRTGEPTENAVLLHCHPSARSNHVEDIADALSKVIDMNAVASLGAYMLNQLWICELKDGKTRDSPTNQHEVAVKGKRSVREVNIEVHWVPICIPDKRRANTLEPYGAVKHVAREM